MRTECKWFGGIWFFVYWWNSGFWMLVIWLNSGCAGVAEILLADVKTNWLRRNCNGGIPDMACMLKMSLVRYVPVLNLRHIFWSTCSFWSNLGLAESKAAYPYSNLDLKIYL